MGAGVCDCRGGIRSHGVCVSWRGVTSRLYGVRPPLVRRLMRPPVTQQAPSDGRARARRSANCCGGCSTSTRCAGPQLGRLCSMSGCSSRPSAWSQHRAPSRPPPHAPCSRAATTTLKRKQRWAGGAVECSPRALPRTRRDAGLSRRHQQHGSGALDTHDARRTPTQQPAAMSGTANSKQHAHKDSRRQPVAAASQHGRLFKWSTHLACQQLSKCGRSGVLILILAAPLV